MFPLARAEQSQSGNGELSFVYWNIGRCKATMSDAVLRTKRDQVVSADRRTRLYPDSCMRSAGHFRVKFRQWFWAATWGCLLNKRKTSPFQICFLFCSLYVTKVMVMRNGLIAIIFRKWILRKRSGQVSQVKVTLHTVLYKQFNI